MNALSPESVRSLLVSSFENCNIEKAQRIVDRYASLPLSPKNISLEKEEGEREQGFLIRHIKHPKSSDMQFILINDLADFQDPNTCLVITYDVRTKLVMGYQKCKYVLHLVSTASKKNLAIRYYAIFSKSNQLYLIISRPLLYAALWVIQHLSFSTSITVYQIPPQELRSLEIPFKLIDSMQINFLSSEDLLKENGQIKRKYSHIISCESYTYLIIKCLATYAILGATISWIAIFLLRSLIAIF